MSSYYERIKETIHSGKKNIASLLWWLFGRSPAQVKAAAVPGGTRIGATLWRLLTKSPKLIRRGVQGIVIYAISYVAEKFLDKAHEEFPDNRFIAKMDAMAHAAMKVENFLITGAASMAKDLYDSIPVETMPPKAPEPALIPAPPLPSELTRAVTPPDLKETASLPTPDLTKAATETSSGAIAIPQVNASDLEQPVGIPISLAPPNPPIAVVAPVAAEPTVPITTREASFMPIETGQRNRANLNAALMPPIQPESITPTVAPDGLPIDGGYDPASEITWGPYMRPFPRSATTEKSTSYLSNNRNMFPQE